MTNKIHQKYIETDGWACASCGKSNLYGNFCIDCIGHISNIKYDGEIPQTWDDDRTQIKGVEKEDE